MIGAIYRDKARKMPKDDDSCIFKLKIKQIISRLRFKIQNQKSEFKFKLTFELDFKENKKKMRSNLA